MHSAWLRALSIQPGTANLQQGPALLRCMQLQAIRVCNKYGLSDPLPGTHREVIMRGTPLGNPFPMRNHSDAERDRVCDRYLTWLRQQWQTGGPAKAELLRLLVIAEHKPLELVCCCAPKRCHGDSVKAALEGIAARRP